MCGHAALHEAVTGTAGLFLQLSFAEARCQVQVHCPQRAPQRVALCCSLPLEEVAVGTEKWWPAEVDRPWPPALLPRVQG